MASRSGAGGLAGACGALPFWPDCAAAVSARASTPEELKDDREGVRAMARAGALTAAIGASGAGAGAAGGAIAGIAAAGAALRYAARTAARVGSGRLEAGASRQARAPGGDDAPVTSAGAKVAGAANGDGDGPSDRAAVMTPACSDEDGRRAGGRLPAVLSGVEGRTARSGTRLPARRGAG